MKDTEGDIARAAQLIRTSPKTIALTGAGVSTESGIPDFRSQGGLWSRFDPLEYGTLGAFKRDPVKVWRMLAELVALVDAKPNDGHMAMAALEQANLLAGIITQNIDSLHQKAGSSHVVEFHGSFNSFTCLHCQANYPWSEVKEQPLPPLCQQCHGILKPDVVFFDEQIPAPAQHQTQELIHKAEVLIVAGTSCSVVPASTIPASVAGRGGKIIEINTDPVLGSATVVLKGSFAGIMARLAAALL